LKGRMMAAHDFKASVFMVRNCDLKDGVPEIPTFLKHKAESLRALGWEVFIGGVDDRRSIRGILRNVQRLKKEVARHEPGLVHAKYGSVTAAVAYLIKGKLPLVVSFCGDDLLGTPEPGLGWRVRERWARAIGLWAARRAAAILVRSNNLYQALPANLKNRATILPDGVDVSRFRPMDRDKCRAKLGWPIQPRVVLFNASQNDNQRVKNPALARAAVEVLARSVPDVSLHMISEASSEEVRLMLNAADCLLVTSLHEGSPNIVKEAMACNLPVVSVPCGDVAERLKRTYPGGIRPYDAAALAEAIHEVLKTGRHSNGREQIVLQGLTLAKVAEGLVEIYRRVQQHNSNRTEVSADDVCVA
jgi:teichuronic acid biosynthesis glycosyltransferase TuaC